MISCVIQRCHVQQMVVPRFSVDSASHRRCTSTMSRWKTLGGESSTQKSKDHHGRNGEILKRIKEVKHVEDSRRVVEQLLKEGSPIAVDMEGINTGVTGLIQIRDVHGNFSFFRPRKNPALYQEGGLAKLLESPHILKILHASTGDAASVYKDGVKMWGVYDTEVAHRVLEFQINGASLTNVQSIGLNNLCAYCGIESNPLKGKIKFNPWNQRNENENKTVMSEEFMLYCAWDVEQLHEIHQILSSLITPDYQHLQAQLSEVELLRSIDPNLATIKKANVKAMESRALFLSYLSASVKKPDLYKMLALFEGNRQVFFSPQHQSAHLVLESRMAAVQALEKLKASRRSLGTTGNKASMKLVAKLEINEVFVVDNEAGTEVVTDGLTPYELTVEVLTAVVDAKVPVVMEFVSSDSSDSSETVIEIYYGSDPIVKLLLNRENVDAGLGALMASEAVPKVLLKIGDMAVSQAFKAFRRLDVEVANIFDIESAAKFFDFAECGQSVFTSAGKKIQRLVAKYGLPGIPAAGKVEWYYLTFLHLATILPPPILRLLEEKSKLEVGLACYQDLSELKFLRQELRKRMDQQTLHLRKLSGSKAAFKTFVEETIEAGGQEMLDYQTLPRGVSLVTFPTRRTALEALTLLQSQLDTPAPHFRFVVTFPERCGTLLDNLPPPPQAQLDELEARRVLHLRELKEARLAFLEEGTNQPSS